MPTTFTAEAYRAEAERVRQLADAAASDAIRAELLDLAQQYEDLAALAEIENQAADAGSPHRDQTVLRF
jgi:hypothetical protein